MALYRKKPVEVEAVQFVTSNWREIEEFGGRSVKAIGNWTHPDDVLCLHVKTLEGTMTALPGDWIIKGVRGEFYPCKPDVFAASYEPATPSQQDTQ